MTGAGVGPFLAAGGLAALVLVRPGLTPECWRDPATAWFAAVAASALLWLGPGLPPAWSAAAADTGMALFPGTALLFGAALFPDSVPQRPGAVLVALGTVLAGMSATAPRAYVAWEAVAALVLAAVALALLVLGALRALRDRRAGAVSLLAGALVVAAALARDALAAGPVTAVHPYALLVFGIVGVSLLERRDRRALAQARDAVAASAAEEARQAETGTAPDEAAEHLATLRHGLHTPLAGLAGLAGATGEARPDERLAIAARTAATLRRLAARLAGADGDRLKVLVVEDVAVSRRLAHDLLRAEGHAVATAADGAGAVAAVAAETHDLVLMDMRLPDTDGMAVTRRIRALDDPRTARVPVIALTTDVGPGEMAAYRQAGLDGAIAKPLNTGRLYEILAESVVPESLEAPAQSETAVVDDRWTALTETFEPRELRGFLDTLTASVTEGREAVRRARGANDPDAVARAAHRMAGAAANFGFAGLEQAARRLESALEGSRADPVHPAILVAVLEMEAAVALETVEHLRTQAADTDSE